MTLGNTAGVWVFNGGGQFPSGVFSSKEKAEEWIGTHALTGVLTFYPLDEGMYEWAVRHGYFTPKKEHQTTSAFIGEFACGAVHHHYDRGRRV